ncbi:MAG: amino acid decarboxylase [Saprospiraceae bacterium]|nr:amino acid decarboxylase [Saprospiraceae bacterium]
MKTTPTPTTNQTLDPTNWDEARQLMHQMIDDAVDYLSTIREKPIWQPMPEEVQASFEEPVPREASSAQEVYSEFQEKVLPYPMGNVHPKFWAWYMGSGTLSGALGDFWASIMNPNLGGGNHAANKVEAQVVKLLKEIMQFPTSASGLLVSGGSMANLVGLTVARNVKAGYNLRQEGFQPNHKMIVYASTEVHSCNQKALELLGMGTSSLVKIPVNSDYTININALQQRIKADRDSGFHPICVIGTSGTVNTGAIDDLNTLADFCEAENLWFHVDGAIGAIAMLSDIVRPHLSGIERADSVAIDLHKWLHMPFEAACVLVKDGKGHKNTFSLIPEYLAKNTRGIAAGDLWFSEYGLQLSRRFRALKIWMSLKEHGTERFGDMITKNVNQAHYLAELVNESADMEQLAPIGLDILCFRYNPGDLSLEELNTINKEIKTQLEESGKSAPGYTTLDGRYCIRVAIANHRSRKEDFEELLNDIRQIGVTLRGAIPVLSQ